MQSLKEGTKELLTKVGDRFGNAPAYLKKVYYKANKLTGGALGIIRHTFNNFTMMRGPEAAASLSYYSLFSIFPILLAAVSIASTFLEQEMVQQKLLEVVNEFVPVSANSINNLISGVLEQRGAFTAVAIIGLIWSASNVFEKIIVNINRAFPKGRNPGFIQSRAMALVIILVIVVLFLASIILDMAQSIFQIEHIQSIWTALANSPPFESLSWVIPLVIKLLLFLAMYSWIPRNKSILFKARLIGAMVAAGLWEMATRGLSWALATGFTNYEVVYGSLSSIISLLTWLYLTGYILFLGAHLTHALNYHFLQKQPVEVLPEDVELAKNGEITND